MKNPNLSILVWFGAMIVVIVWGICSVIDYVFIKDYIISNKPIKPILELVIVDNKLDTLYKYEQ